MKLKTALKKPEFKNFILKSLRYSFFNFEIFMNFQAIRSVKFFATNLIKNMNLKVQKYKQLNKFLKIKKNLEKKILQI